VAPNVVSFSSCISACEKAGEWQRALDLLCLMPTQEVSPNAYSFSSAISACQKSSEWQQALAVFSAMTSSLAPDVFACSGAISACEPDGQWKQGLALLSSMGHWHIIPNIVCLSAAISACGRGEAWQAAMALWRDLPRRFLRPDAVCFNSAISACEKSGRWREALDLLSRHPRPSSVSFNAAVSACEKEGLWQLGFALLAAMEKCELQGDAITWNSVISCCEKGSRWSAAWALINEMPTRQVLPDVISLNSAFLACAQCGQWLLTLHILQLMAWQGCVELVRRFDFRHFRRVAAVVVGEPPESFKAKVRSAVLAEKQEKLDAEWNAQEVLRQQQKALREKQKAMEEAQKRMAEAAASAAASATAAAQAAEAPTEAKEEGKDEEMKEVKEEGAKEEGVQEEIKEEPEPEQQLPVAELDEEEQKLWFLPRPVTDMVPTVFNSTFMDFSLPTDEEDFAEIRYEWATELVSKEYMRSWMQAKKITTRVEDINCSETFTNRVFEWQRLQNEWQVKQKDFKSDPVKQQAAEVRADKEKRYEEKQEKQQPEAEAAEDELDGFVPLDIYSVKDVADIGEGEPLFANFSLEDWALLNLRFELTILMQGFRQDVADPERPGIHESHLGFYYNKYFRKPLNIKFFGVSTAVELCALAKDVVTIQENGVLAPSLSEEQLANLDMLVRLTEAARRERHRRIEAGDESSRLKFTVQQGQSPWPKATPKPWSSWSPAQPVAARPGFQPRPGTGTGARPIRAQGGFGFSGWGGFPGAFQGSW
ncbi:unnamed protein product, partial [Effrenium voratum]